MSRRHEDQSPAGRKKRGKVGSTRPTKKGPAKKGPTTKGPAKKSPATKGPAKKGPTKKGPTKKGPAKKAWTKKPSPAQRSSTTRRMGSARRQTGLVVTSAGPAAAKTASDGKVRLNQFLAQCGIASRRGADELIAAGRIELNGEIVRELGTRVDPQGDEVLYDGKPVRQEKAVYVLFNKPKGVVCTNSRQEQKKRVIDFMPTVRGRLFTVGRLDLDSEGAILLTNDGPFAQEMTHPRYGVPKLYNVILRGRVSQEELQRARGGVWLSEGPTAGMQLRVARATRDKTYLKVTLREGKNREIRRVFAKLGFPVVTLKRIRIGELTLHGLGVGKWRFVQLHEIQELRQLARRDELPAEE